MSMFDPLPPKKFVPKPHLQRRLDEAKQGQPVPPETPADTAMRKKDEAAAAEAAAKQKRQGVVFDSWVCQACSGVTSGPGGVLGDGRVVCDDCYGGVYGIADLSDEGIAGMLASGASSSLVTEPLEDDAGLPTQEEIDASPHAGITSPLDYLKYERPVATNAAPVALSGATAREMLDQMVAAKAKLVKPDCLGCEQAECDECCPPTSNLVKLAFVPETKFGIDVAVGSDSAAIATAMAGSPISFSPHLNAAYPYSQRVVDPITGKSYQVQSASPVWCCASVNCGTQVHDEQWLCQACFDKAIAKE